MVSEKLQKELDAARQLGAQLEEIVVSKKYTDRERDTLLLGYWDLVSDFHKGLHALVQREFFAPAFALVRPVIEGLVRAHVTLMAGDEDIKRLRNDEYKVNFKEIGPRIDQAFGLGNLMKNLLNERTRNALHSYTHAGLMQLGRRFESGYIKPNYSDDEVVEIIRVTTSALAMLTILVTKHFGFEGDWNKVSDLYAAWGRH